MDESFNVFLLRHIQRTKFRRTTFGANAGNQCFQPVGATRPDDNVRAALEINVLFVVGIKKLTSRPVVGVGRFTSPDLMVRQVKSGILDLIGAARRAIADGASVIVPGPAFYATLAHRAGLTQVDGALVLDTVATAVKTAEMLAGLRRAGVQPSRRIGVYCKPDPAFEAQALARMRDVFRLD